jgi:Fur family peroxide stress response transcriptional regulator
MNYSKQREVILKYVKSVKTHPTAEDVHSNIIKENPNISLGTVYRNLEKLSSIGDMKRLKFITEKDRFDGNTDHHYHGICVKCGKVIDIFTDYMFEIDNKISNENNILVVSHELIFNTICDNCK